MKILFLTGSYPSINCPTPSIFTHNQAKAVQKQGADVSVLVIDMRSIRRKRRLGFSKDVYDGITVYRMALPCGPVPILLPFLSKLCAAFAINKIVKSYGKPDLIHAHFSDAGTWAASFKRKKGIPFILTEHGSKMLRVNRTEKTEHASKAAYRHADALIAVSTALRCDLLDITNKTIFVVPNVVPSFFCYHGTPKPDSFTYISVGNFVPSKRFDITISAFCRINKKYPETRLKIVGDGRLKNDLLYLARSNKTEGKIEFLGVLPNTDLPVIYNSCHCFVLPSMFETFGVSYAEAIACGLPVIATKCGGPEDFVNESNGLIVPTDDLDAVVSAMEHMLLNRKNYSGAGISKEILCRLDESRIGKDLIDIYSKHAAMNN